MEETETSRFYELISKLEPELIRLLVEATPEEIREAIEQLEGG